MTKEDLKNLVMLITGYSVTRIEETAECCFTVYVAGSVYPHDRYNVNNSVPITMHVNLEEGWPEEKRNK